MRRLKDRMYNYFVKKNGRVWYEYERYVREHMEEHRLHRFRHLRVLIKLNWFYRVKKGNTPYLYWDVPLDPNVKVSNDVVNMLNPSKVNGKIDEQVKANCSELLIAEKKSVSPKENRLSVMSLVSQLVEYDIVSFDIFDTLIFRPFSNPRDLFYILGRKFEILDFRKIRIDAEDMVRKQSEMIYGNYEVTLNEIYKYIERRTGLNAEYGVKVEVETEQELCYANPYMLRVFRLLKSQNKKMIATSDMYLSSVALKKILSSCGYEGLDDIYVSCEFGVNKRNGGLYKTLKKRYGDSAKMIHIGDNWESDILSAKRNEIDTKFYKNVNVIGKKHIGTGMSDLIGSAYAGIVNAWMYSGVKQYSPYYEFGFVYGGIYLLGYCNWIHEKVKKEKIDKVIFLSRDGEIYQTIYKMLFDKESNTELLYWSRIANVKASITEMRSNFLSSTVKNKAADNMHFTAKTLLKTLNLQGLEKYLQNYHLNPDTVIIWENYKILEEMLIDHWDEVVDLYVPYEEASRVVLKDLIGDARKVAVVDVGWTGTGPLGIRRLVHNKWKWDVEVYCYVAASRVWGHVSNISQITEQIIEPYIFSRQYNRNLYDTHVQTNNNTNNIYFEFFTQADYPSFAGYYLKDGKIMCEFDIPEVENYEKVQEIHDGIKDFCKEYLLRFKKEPWMQNISGYDAYIPFRCLILNMQFLKKNFCDFQFARGIASDESQQKLESMRSIWNKENMI